VSEPVDVRIDAVDWLDPRAVALRASMDAETQAMYAEFVAGQPETVTAAIQEALRVDPADILVTILALHGGEPVGHAALRPPSGLADALEVKKVFVSPSHRGRGISRVLMLELERLAVDRGVPTLVLQTGRLQVPAITLYESLGYRAIDPFGGYTEIPGALCFEKLLV
jgi:GNAT superfamily N-acetyltransferase